MLPRYALLAGADLASKALGFAILVVLARGFGAAGLGQLALASTLVGYVAIAAACGTDVWAVRTAARDRAVLPSVARTVVSLRLVLAAVSYAGLLLLALAVPGLRPHLPWVAAYGLTLFTGAVSLGWAAQALERTVVLAAANAAVPAIALAALLAAMAVAGPSLAVAPGAQVLAEAAVAVALWWVLRQPVLPEARASGPGWRQILGPSVPIGAAQLLRSASFASDLLLLGILASLDEVGWYVAAFRVYLLGISLSAAYFLILLPRLSRQSASDAGAGLRGAVLRSLGQTLLVAVPAGVAAAALAAPILRVLFGGDFAAAARPLAILAAAAVASVAGGHFRNALLAQGRPGADLGIVAVGSTVHVALKLALIPLLGMSGAALGTLGGEAAVLLAGLAVIRWHEPANASAAGAAMPGSAA